MQQESYSLMTVQGTRVGPEISWNFEIFKEIDKSTYDGITEAVEALDPFLEFDLLPYVQFSYSQFEAGCNDAEARINKPDRTPIDVRMYSFALSCHLLTFLSALVTFAEQTVKKIATNFGKESQQFLQVRRYFNDVYDTRLGYRFCSRLRQLLPISL